MRISTRARVAIASIAAAAAILVSACSDSNDVTGPGNAANLAGTWTGQYDANVPSLCTSGSATASLTQTDNQVRGTFEAPGCGIKGAFRGTVSGNALQGTVDMLGCTGGAVSGRFEAGELTFVVGDFRKDLVAGDVEVLPGGEVRLQR